MLRGYEKYAFFCDTGYQDAVAVFPRSLLCLTMSKQKNCVHITTGGLKSWQKVACYPETRDHRRDMRSRHCNGHHRSSGRCQVLLGQHQRRR